MGVGCLCCSPNAPWSLEAPGSRHNSIGVASARWFRETRAGEPALRFHGGRYPTHELDALAAIEGSGVALLSPTLFRALIDEGKLLQPFAHVLQGPNQHYLLLRRQEERAPVLEFASWLRSEAVLGAARA